MSNGNPVCIFGEVLFDHFPDGNRVLGGAPFNVAWHLQAFGQAPRLISRVGRDAEGEQVRAAMGDWGLTTDCLQTDPERPTGRVAVSFTDGEPAYDIVPDCAYDHIEPVPLESCGLLYHGSLAARGPVSAGSLRRLRADKPENVFIDVNLRPPWWQPRQLQDMLEGAQWVKLNGGELALLCNGARSGNTARDFLERYALQGLLLTRGAKGAELLLTSGECLQVAPTAGTQVVDTVGAGDAFAAVMLLGLRKSWPMTLTLQRAQQFAAAVVGQQGATSSNPDFYREFIRQWHSAD